MGRSLALSQPGVQGQRMHCIPRVTAKMVPSHGGQASLPPFFVGHVKHDAQNQQSSNGFRNAQFHTETRKVKRLLSSSCKKIAAFSVGEEVYQWFP